MTAPSPPRCARIEPPCPLCGGPCVDTVAVGSAVPLCEFCQVEHPCYVPPPADKEGRK